MIAIASSEENATPSIRRKTHKINSRKSMGGSHFVGTRYGTVDLHKEALLQANEVFQSLDTDKNGKIDAAELGRALLQANEVFQSLDTDKNGKIDAAELGRAFLCLDVDIPNSHKTQVVDAMLHYLGKDQKGLIAMWRETAALQQLTGMNAAGVRVQRRSNYVVDMDQKEQDKVVNDADTNKKELALGLENCVLQLRSALEAVNEMKIKLAQLN